MLHYLQNLFQALDVSSLTEAVLRVAAVFLCLTVHETCHGLAALALGDPTAKSMHRLSLNPLHHIDWLGLALMFTVGFGWAKPVPVNPNYFRKPKQGMAVTALAGPVSNLILAVLFLGIGKVIYLYAPYSAGMNVFFEWCLFTVAPHVRWYGAFQPDPHSAAGRVQGTGDVFAQQRLRSADALRAVRYSGSAGAELAGPWRKFSWKRDLWRVRSAVSYLFCLRCPDFGKSCIQTGKGGPLPV